MRAANLPPSSTLFWRKERTNTPFSLGWNALIWIGDYSNHFSLFLYHNYYKLGNIFFSNKFSHCGNCAILNYGTLRIQIHKTPIKSLQEIDGHSHSCGSVFIHKWSFSQRIGSSFIFLLWVSTFLSLDTLKNDVTNTNKNTANWSFGILSKLQKWVRISKIKSIDGYKGLCFWRIELYFKPLKAFFC